MGWLRIFLLSVLLQQPQPNFVFTHPQVQQDNLFIIYCCCSDPQPFIFLSQPRQFALQQLVINWSLLPLLLLGPHPFFTQISVTAFEWKPHIPLMPDTFHQVKNKIPWPWLTRRSVLSPTSSSGLTDLLLMGSMPFVFLLSTEFFPHLALSCSWVSSPTGTRSSSSFLRVLRCVRALTQFLSGMLI